MSKIYNNFKKFLIGILPTIFTLYLLMVFFPYTGLERILSIPITLVLNIFIVIVGGLLTLKQSKLVNKIVWSAITIITILTAVLIHPQPNRPTVLEQIFKLLGL